MTATDSKPAAPKSPSGPAAVLDEVLNEEAEIRRGGGEKAIARQHAKNRPRAGREAHRPGRVLPGAGPVGGHGMYAEHGGAPAAGVVTGVGPIHGRPHMIIANDATVKAGAFFPMTCKKIIRAQHIAHMAACRWSTSSTPRASTCRCRRTCSPTPTTSGGSSISTPSSRAEGIPQTAAIMGNCVAGGGYLPVLCDTLLMTEGSGLYLAGPGARQGRDRAGGHRRGTGRRVHARGDLGHDRLQGARRRRVPRAPARGCSASARDRRAPDRGRFARERPGHPAPVADARDGPRPSSPTSHRAAVRRHRHHRLRRRRPHDAQREGHESLAPTSTSTRPTTGARSSAATPAWAGTPSASSPTR
jgi:hypothetical protein